MIREACRACGRVSVDDDSARCRQTQDQSGEYNCPGDGPRDVDDEGYFLYQTPEEDAAEAAYWENIYARTAIERGDHLPALSAAEPVEQQTKPPA